MEKLLSNENYGLNDTIHNLRNIEGAIKDTNEKDKIITALCEVSGIVGRAYKKAYLNRDERISTITDYDTVIRNLREILDNEYGLSIEEALYFFGEIEE